MSRMTPHREASPAAAEAERRLGVVVVEPVPEIMDRIRTVLSRHPDLEVLVEAATADQALGEMRQLRHRLGVVAVVSMTLSGEHDALWLIRAIRRNYPTFPVIACGLTTDPDTISHALFAGADGFVGLGVKAAQFVASLRKAVDRGQAEGEQGAVGPLIVVPGEELRWPEEAIPLEETEPPVPEVATAAPAPPPLEAGPAAPGVGLAERLSKLFAGRRRREEPPERTERAAPVPLAPAPPAAEVASAPVEARAAVEAPPAPPVEVGPAVEAAPAPDVDVGPAVQAPRGAPVEAPAAVQAPRGAPVEAAPPGEAPAPVAPLPVGAEEPGPTARAEEVVAEEAPPALPRDGEAADQEEVPLEPVEELPREVVEEAGPEPGPAPREPEVAVEAEAPGEEADGVRTEAERARELLEAIPSVPEAAPLGAQAPKEGAALPVRVVAVGAPQEFRDQVALALGVAESGAVEWVPTVTAAEELLLRSEHPVEVLVVAPKVKEADAFGLAETAMRTSPATTVIFAREGDRERIAPRAMRAGVRDVVDLTLGVEDLKDALDRAVAWAVSLRSTRAEARRAEDLALGSVISVFSSKGGTGKTFLTANLGLALADRTGDDVALFDLDFVMGDLFAYFGQEPDRSIEELLEVGSLTDPNDIRAAGTKLADRVWGYAAVPAHDASPPAQAVSRVLRALRRAFPYVVVDASTEYSDRALEVFDASEAICLVTGLDIVGARHLSVDLETLRRLHLPREKMRIVLNRADAKVGLDRSAVERALRVTVDAAIPSSPLVPTSVNRGRPLYLDEPDSEVARRVGELADRLLPGAGQEPRRKRRLRLR
jgi:pilus assembly protein CpaE